MARPPSGTTELTQLFRRNLAALMADRPELSSQNALAKVCKVGQTSIGRILNGQQSPTLDMVFKIAHAFGVPGWRMLQPPLGNHEHGQRPQAYDRLLKAAEELAPYLEQTPMRKRP